MIRLLGRQENSVRYFFDRYCYYHDRRVGGNIFRCVKRNLWNCPARIYVEDLENLENEEIRDTYYHNHLGDNLLLLKEEFLQELLTLARSTFDDLYAIYDSVKRKEM